VSGPPEKQKRPPPERGDALRVDLPFEEAIKAALETKPPPKERRKRKKPPKA